MEIFQKFTRRAVTCLGFFFFFCRNKCVPRSGTFITSKKKNSPLSNVYDVHRNDIPKQARNLVHLKTEHKSISQEKGD